MSPWEKATAGEVRGKRHLIVAIPTEDVLVLLEANAYSRHSMGVLNSTMGLACISLQLCLHNLEGGPANGRCLIN